jgi:hypothetical protein
VAASVFDDDFFRPRDVQRNAEGGGNDLSAGRGVLEHREPEVRASQAEGRVPAFVGYSTPAETEPTTDELDIPAFLRRTH